MNAAPTLNGNQAVAEGLLALFRGREDYVARGTERGTFEPAKLPGPMRPEWLARHLGGTQCAGFYLMRPDNTVWCSCADFDNKPEKPDPEWRVKAEGCYFWLTRLGLSPLVEVSQSGRAAHVWLFFEEPTEAWVARAWWRAVAEQGNVPVQEVYPRQDVLTGKGLGNLVRYPLWNQSRFVNPEEEWAAVDPAEALTSARRTSAAELKELAARYGVTLRPGPPPVTAGQSADVLGGLPPRVKARLERYPDGLLARRWRGDQEGMKDKTTSALVLSIACELVRQFVPTPEITAALRHWCEEHKYEKGADERALGRCVGRAYEYVQARCEERAAATVEIHDAARAFIDTLRRGERGHLPSGIPELDQSIEGVGYGEMCVIAARPGHGKSALALQWLEHATGVGNACLLISAEMSRLELGKRFVLFVSKLGQEHWGPETAHLLDADVDGHRQGRAPLELDDGCTSLAQAEEAIDRAAARGVRVVAVDYLQLLGSRGQKRYEQVTDISMRLKQAAKRNNVALLALSQLNREIEKRVPPEPKLSDLRDAGQIEQDADLVLFVVWPHKLDPLMPADLYTVFAAKRRNGPVHKPRIDTTFTPSRQRIGPFPASRREPGYEG
jgi:archaellum biogenesis ATPase FlaH